MLSVSMEHLQESGYKQYKDFFKSKVSSYVTSFQKKFSDSNGIKFFVNFHIYDHENLPGYDVSKFGRYGYEATCQFNSHGNKATFDVLRFIRDWESIEEVEDFFKVMFVSMECNYYELYE